MEGLRVLHTYERGIWQSLMLPHVRHFFLRGTEDGIMPDIIGMDTTIGYANHGGTPIGAWRARCISVQGCIQVYIFHNNVCNLSTGHAIYLTSVAGGAGPH